MAEWSSGYVVDVGYTHGFYPELTPSFLAFLTLLHGVQGPQFVPGALTYCELGCGQGLSTNILAAANPAIEFYATDFNPGHIAGARSLARSADLPNVHFFDDSFKEFLGRDDLPNFDFIALHGIYSWISAENRQAIVQFIREKLKPGGIVYISYNSMPGWASMMPLRRLLVEHAATQGSSRSLPSRISASLGFAERLGSLGTKYFATHPKLAGVLEGLKRKDPNYIAHEYFNRDLTPFYFMDVAQELSEAKLTWVGAANVLETIDTLHLTEEQEQLLAEIDDVALRQTVRDHIIDQQFRRDIFIKGPLPLGHHLAKERWLDMRFLLSREGSGIPRHVQGIRSRVGFRDETYTPLIAALDRGPQTLRELMDVPAIAGIGLGRLIQAITFLVAQGSCQPCLPEHGAAERKVQADRLNRAIAEHARYDGKINYFASGVTGGGIVADRIGQLIWLALSNNERDVPQFIWRILSRNGQRMMKDGKSLTTDEDNLAEIRSHISNFEKKSLGVWRSLGLEPARSVTGVTERHRLSA